MKVSDKERKVLKRGLPRARYSCPHCGHRHMLQKLGKIVCGWFCGKCKKKSNGTEKYTNKFGKERTRAKRMIK